MLDLWPQRAGLKERADEIAAQLRVRTTKLAVRAGIGAGRHSIVTRLATMADVFVVEFPAFDDLDAPLHGLVQIASQAGAMDAVAAHGGTLSQKVELVSRALVDAGRALVVLMPVPRAGHPREADVASQHQIEQMVRVLVEVENLSVAVIATPRTRLRDRFTHSLKLEASLIGAGMIRPGDLPDEFASAASRLAAWMAKHNAASSPLEVRLQVGLIALGETPDQVGGARLEALARKMATQLGRWKSLAVAVHRLLLARRALPLDEVARLSELDARWLPLLTACIGYGDNEIRVPEATRQVLLDALKAPPDDRERAHAELARHHELLDGAHSLRGLGQLQAVNWLEKVHHLALGGASCAMRWHEQEPAGREQVWERARYLSRELHRFEDAAALYQACIGRFGDDPYSSHYLAYNLDRAHGDTTRIRQGYRAAASQAPDNPWWQQRWIRFLITNGTLAEARATWQRASRLIDPDGVRMRSSPWLALNFHFWVARRWLALGYLEDADAVLSEVSDQWLTEEAELRALMQTLRAQQQALLLGEAVYPASTPLEARWRRPRSLRPVRAGHLLTSWAPGRVVEASRNEVTIVIAPTDDDAQQLTFDAATWRQIAGDPAEDASGFLELGVYADGERVVRTVPDDEEDSHLDLEEAELLARLASQRAGS